MILYSNCKINLGLNIVAKRNDGYHDIESVMIPIRELFDIIEIVSTDGSGVEFSSTGIKVDCADEKNLCIKAYNLMSREFGIGGVKMHLHKVIPFGAGLGGGSSNAAFVIKGLNEIFNLGLSIEKMEQLAAELGSDTSFFIRNQPQFATGRGEILSPCSVNLKGIHLLLIKPDVAVSTAEAYANVIPSKPELSILEHLKSDITTWKHSIANDFEKTLFPKKNELEKIKNYLLDNGAIYASMSGSGSTVYGFFDQKPDTDLWTNQYFTHHELLQ